MAYPVTGAEGSVPTWGSTGLYNSIITATSPNTATLTAQSDAQDVTPIGGTSRSILPGLGQWSVSIGARTFATPRMGNVGLVAFSTGGYSLHVESWSLTLEPMAIHDITSFIADPNEPRWRVMRPDRAWQWSGSITCRVDDATSLANADTASNSSTAVSLPTLTLTYGADTNANLVSGAVMLSNLSVNQSQGGLTTATYQFTGSGALSHQGTNSIFSRPQTTPVAIPAPLWSQLGATTNTLLTMTAFSGKTYSGDAFLRSLTMTCAVGSPVELSIEAQGSGPLSIA